MINIERTSPINIFDSIEFMVLHSHNGKLIIPLLAFGDFLSWVMENCPQIKEKLNVLNIKRIS